MNVVTGAFGYTGRYITAWLLASGERIKTITGHPHRPDPFGGQVSVAPLNFDRPEELARSLEGADVLYNTYWVRFNRGPVTFAMAVENTRTLVEAAEMAGIRRMVHISITNASPDSPLPYFRGKGQVEELIKGSKLSYAIIRPTVIFGNEDVLINNISWFLRRFPLFPIPRPGSYQLQPVFVEDLAEIAVEAAGWASNVTVDAAGPETFTYEELVGLIAKAVGSRATPVHVGPGQALFLCRLAGLLVRDLVLTRDEISGLMAGLLVGRGPPAGRTKLSTWLLQNASTVGRHYASELRRHY